MNSAAVNIEGACIEKKIILNKDLLLFFYFLRLSFILDWNNIDYIIKVLLTLSLIAIIMSEDSF